MDGTPNITPNITMKSLLFFILLAGSFGIFNIASAGTLDVVNTNGETVRFTVDINKTSFLPTPETIVVSGYAYSYASTNNSISLSATTNGATVSLFNSVNISPSSWSDFYSKDLTGLSSPGSSSVVFSASVYTDPIPAPPAELQLIDMYVDPSTQVGTYQVIKSNADGTEYTIAMSPGVNTGFSPTVSIPDGPYIVLNRDIYCPLSSYPADFQVSPTAWPYTGYDTFWVYPADHYTMTYNCPAPWSGGGGEDNNYVPE